jgi:putative ABC transport system permease protein
MSLMESLRAGLRALGVHKVRSSLTALGIVIGVAAVVCMVAVAAGAQMEVAERIRSLGANLLLVIPGAQTSGGARLEAGTRHTLTEDDTAAIERQIQRAQVVAPLLSRPMQVIAGDKNWATTVAGINADYLAAREWTIARGRPFTTAELQLGAKVAIIGSAISEQLFENGGGAGETVRIGNVPFSVIGVLTEKGRGASGRSQDDIVFIPLSTAQGRVLGAVHGGMRSALDYILVKAVDADAIPDLKSDITSLMRQRHQLRADAPDDFVIENPADVLTARQEAQGTLGILLIAIASVSLLVGGISIMNIMLVSVSERTREIGLRVAVGARRRDIRRQFLIEAATLTSSGGLVGAWCGSAAAIAIAWQAGWPVVLSPWAIVLACGFAGLVGIAFGLYPAVRAARLDPIIALRCD